MIFTKEEAGKMADKALGEDVTEIDEYVLSRLIEISDIDGEDHLLTPVTTCREINDDMGYRRTRIKESVERLEGMGLIKEYYKNSAHAMRYYVLPDKKFDCPELFPETKVEEPEKGPETVFPDEVYYIMDSDGYTASSEFYTSFDVAYLAMSLLNSTKGRGPVTPTDDGYSYHIETLVRSENEKRLLDER